MRYSTGEPITNPLRETSGLLSMRGSRAFRSIVVPQTTSSSFPLTIYIIFLANEWPPPTYASLSFFRCTVIVIQSSAPRLLEEEQREREIVVRVSATISCRRGTPSSDRGSKHRGSWWRKMTGENRETENPPLQRWRNTFLGEFRIPRAFIFTFHEALPRVNPSHRACFHKD